MLPLCAACETQHHCCMARQYSTGRRVGIYCARGRTLEGTIWPSLIISATMLPSGLPDFMCALSRSPALRCTIPKSSTSFAHCKSNQRLEMLSIVCSQSAVYSDNACWLRVYSGAGNNKQSHSGTVYRVRCTCVPLPEPGPPSTKTMVRSAFGVVDPTSEIPAPARSCMDGKSGTFQHACSLAAVHRALKFRGVNIDSYVVINIERVCSQVLSTWF